MKITFALLCLLLCEAANGAAPVDGLQERIQKDLITVRSIDPADEDFSDLVPLIDKFGTARVVQLGEPGHGAGSSFSAKARLVKFLHERMGFEVLVWESGLYDVGLSAEQGIFRSGRRRPRFNPCWSRR